MDISILYDTQPSDVFRATHFYFSRLAKTFRITMAVVFLLVGLLAMSVPACRAPGSILLFGGIFQLALPRINAFFMMRRYMSNPAIAKNVQMTISDEGINVRTAVETSSLTWETYKYWLESPDAFLLVVYKGHFLMLFKRTFAQQEDISKLRTFLQHKYPEGTG